VLQAKFCFKIIVVEGKITLCSKSVPPKLCSADPKGSATSSEGIHDKFRRDPRQVPKGPERCSEGIRGYHPVMATLKFDALLKIIVELLQLAICLFRVTVRISN
jgi:hypothetical protein